MTSAPRPLRAGPLFEVRVRASPTCVTLVVRGELDIDTARTLRACVRDLPHLEDAALELDITQVAFVDLVALRQLCELQAELAAAGTPMRLSDCGPAVRRVLALAGLEHLLPPPRRPRAGSWRDEDRW